LFEVNPAGNFSEYHGMAIGARAQSAKTYLEKKFNEFEDGTWE
jgi:20S proteasome subunit alpha 6